MLVNDCMTHVQQGKPFPAEAYTNEELFKLEIERIFKRNWICIGVSHDVSGQGDVLPVSVGKTNLLITRAEDGRIHVFHNYCRHRGMMLTDKPCKGMKKLMCPYHSWIYRLDGSLIRTSNIGGPGKHTPGKTTQQIPTELIPVNSEVWNELIFVDLSGDAISFNKFIEPLEQQWADYDFSGLHWAIGARYDAACNWKLAVENFVDVYHLPSVHQGLNAYSDYSDHYFVHAPGLYGEGNNYVRPDDIAVGKFDDFTRLPDSKKFTLEALALFPNLLVTVTRDHLRIIIVDPISPESCVERVHIFVNGRNKATSPQLEDQRKQLLNRFSEFNDEDLEITARLQYSMNSSFRNGMFSPAFDEAVKLFQRDIVTQLDQDS